MSTLTEEGARVIAVKNAACERLLNKRVEINVKSKKTNECLNRFHVAVPLEVAEQEKRKTEKDSENKNGGAGFYEWSLRKNYVLAIDDWKEDVLPQISDEHNVYGFIDSDILKKIKELEREHGNWNKRGRVDDDDFEIEGNELNPEQQGTLIYAFEGYLLSSLAAFKSFVLSK
ncbi:hypothetical protein RIF29_16012 [Crotalaria pallida]|uniref:NOG C-terminal domain-containing protein n=1 Tax=Crotalaria pallida TaxID=3830 RepID=A0AAN9FGG8_CROPI